jgi:oligopeptide/dipeptide ABC transporter ATP-binding protein
MNEQPPLLSLQRLTVSASRPAGATTLIDGIDLELGAGETLGLVGESGCGKTTTLRAILGLLAPGVELVSGSIIFDGQDLAGAAPRQLNAIRGGQIGVVWQEPLSALDPVMRVGEQIAEAVRAHSDADRHAARERSLELMRLVELPNVERTYRAYPHELSGGQRQRVVIGAAIAANPRLLLADEPTTALDVTVQDQVLALLARLRDEFGLALLLVTHDLAVVDQTCERVAVMYAGRIVEEGAVAAVFDKPRHHYTAGLLRAVPDIQHPGTLPTGIPGAPPAATVERGCAFAPRCPRADQLCVHVTPPLARIGPQRVACHHPLAAELVADQPETRRG